MLHLAAALTPELSLIPAEAEIELATSDLVVVVETPTP
jgi:hypothetical protein